MGLLTVIQTKMSLKMNWKGCGDEFRQTGSGSDSNIWRTCLTALSVQQNTTHSYYFTN
jgi:hypothetical protein